MDGHKYGKQAGAELCQAQNCWVKLKITKYWDRMKIVVWNMKGKNSVRFKNCVWSTGIMIGLGLSTEKQNLEEIHEMDC